MSSSISKKLTITLKCPKCGRVERHEVTSEDLEEIRLIGIARLGFIHGDHSLIVNFDATGFVRGAYIVPSDKIPSDVRIYFREYRVVNKPKIESNIKVILIDDKNKVIDVRLADIGGREIVAIMNYLDAYRSAIKGIARRIGIAGKSYNIVSHNDMIAIFQNISPKKMGICLSCMEGWVQDPYSFLLALKYIANRSPEELESKTVAEMIKYLIESHRIQIRAKKGTNAIRFARASILALWPELTEIFDMIVRDPQLASESGISLQGLMRKNMDIDFGKLYDMLRELMKRDLIEIIKR